MKRITIFTFLFCIALNAQDGPVARVVAAQGNVVTLKVEAGSFVNGVEVDVFTSAGKAKAKMVFPKNLDLLLSGDEVKGITLAGASGMLNGALLAPMGKFANLAAAQKALPGGASLAAAATPAAAPAAPSSGSPFKESATACPYPAAELSAALGAPFLQGKGNEFSFATGKSLSCQYSQARGSLSVVVNRQVMSSGDPAVNRASMERMSAGKLEPVPGDPDGAKWQVGQGDLTNVTLVYYRGNTGVEIRVLGVNMRDAAAVAAMRAKVLQLRRP